MTTPSNPRRRYSDEEVRALMKRAAELESQGGNLPARLEGPTLSDLEAIAAEAGIDPLALREAAMELDSGAEEETLASGLSAGFLGAPLSIELERVVPDEVPDSVLEGLIPAIQRASDGVGQPSLLGRTLTWQSVNAQAARALQVTVTSGGGKTRLFAEERYGNMAGGLFGGIMGGVGGGVGIGVGFGVGLGALGSVLFATVFPVAILGGSYLLSRSIFTSFVRRRARLLKRLMDEMTGLVEEGATKKKLGEPRSGQNPPPALPDGNNP